MLSVDQTGPTGPISESADLNGRCQEQLESPLAQGYGNYAFLGADNVHGIFRWIPATS